MRLLLAILLLHAPLVRAGAPPTLLSDSFGKLTPSSLAAWYDPANNTLNGDGISAVYDKTGQGRTLLQATANNQPLISRSDNKGNLLVQSETFETTWTRTRVNAFGVDDSGSAGAGSFANTSRTLDPTGGNAADFIQEDATASASHYILQTGITLPPGSYTYSAWVKKGGDRNVLLHSIAAGKGRGFNLTTGATFYVTGITDAESYSITDAGNGWFFCTIGFTLAAQTAETVSLRCVNGSTYSYNGDNTSGLFLWGASLRPASWDSDYIATVATPAIAGLNGYRTAYFNGSSHSLEASGFSRPQPHTVIQIVKPWTWTSGDDLFADAVLDGAVMQQTGSSPQIKMYAGSFGPVVSPDLGAHAFLAAVFNGADSLCYLNGNAPTTGNVGSAIASGFCLGARGNQVSGWAHIQSGPVLLYNRALDTNEVAYVGRLSNRQFNLGF